MFHPSHHLLGKSTSGLTNSTMIKLMQPSMAIYGGLYSQHSLEPRKHLDKQASIFGIASPVTSSSQKLTCVRWIENTFFHQRLITQAFADILPWRIHHVMVQCEGEKSWLAGAPSPLGGNLSLSLARVELMTYHFPLPLCKQQDTAGGEKFPTEPSVCCNHPRSAVISYSQACLQLPWLMKCPPIR